MKYLFALLFICACTSFAFGQGQTVRIYNADSSVVGTGVVIDGKMNGLWKLTNPQNGKLLEEGYLKNGKKDGKWVTYHSNSEPHIVSEYKDNKLNGPLKEYDNKGYLVVDAIYKDSVVVGQYKEYYGGAIAAYGYTPGKNLKKEGTFKNGKLDGEWLSYYENGQLAIKSNYKNGNLDGAYLEYSREGQLIIEVNYVDGQPDGTFKRYSYNNAVEQIGEYDKGAKVGKWITYFPETKIIASEKEYDEHGNKTGTWRYFYENRRIARIERYENDIPVGTWEEYFPNKNLSKRKTYELGVPVGEYEENHSDGSPSVRGQYSNGVKSGLWKSYYPDGQLYSIGEYRNGVKSGLWKYFNKIGILIAEGEFQLGSEHGQWFYYYDGGQLKSVGSYFYGFENGKWGLFYDNKQLTQEETWNNGRLMNISEYHTYDGKSTLDKGTLKDGEGSRITYYIDGTKESEGNYHFGKPEGKWMYYHDNGKIASQGMMENGKKEGRWNYYSRSGKLIEIITYKDDEIVPNRRPEQILPFQNFE